MTNPQTKAVKRPARTKQIVESPAAKDDGHEAPAAPVLVVAEPQTASPPLTAAEIRRQARLKIWGRK